MIEDIYREKITQQILLEMLEDGTIPTSVVLAGMLRLVTEGKDLNVPLIAQDKPSISYGELASASKFNDIFKRIWDDMDVLYDTCLSIEDELGLASTRTEAELIKIERDVASLVDRANRLLLVANDTEGLLQTVGDNFQDNSNIDLSNTTAFIDNTYQTVHGGYYTTTEIETENELDLHLIEDADIKVAPLTPELRRAPGTHDSNLTDMLRDTNRPWLYRLDSLEHLESAGVEIIIDFRKAIPAPNSALSINKIAFDPAITNNSVLVGMQYSTDGISWSDLPVVDPIRKLIGPTTFIFEQIDLAFLKIIMTKGVYDSSQNSFTYDFGIRHLGVYGVKTIFVEKSTLVSKQLFPLAADGSPLHFTNVALSKACEHIEPSTNIEYSIAFLIPDGGYHQTDFFPITPLNRENPIGPQVLSVADSSSTQIPTEIDTDDLDFAFNLDTSNRLLAAEGISTTEAIQLWRNIGYNDRMYSVVQPNGTILESGWARDGAHYITYGLVQSIGGTSIDFGPSSIEIDGIDCTGKVLLSQGIHKFRVQEQNWYSLRGMTNVGSVDSTSKKIQGTQRICGADGVDGDLDAPTETSAYAVIDPLYPYNHKLLIEGLNYSDSFPGDKVYKGVARYAAYLPKEISETDMGLFAEKTDYNVFAISRINDSIARKIMVKWTQYGEEDPREQFLITFKSGQYAEGLVFKAMFKTTNPKKTASLDGYQIRVS